ncbi:dimethyladenosine transferase 2, mitochondrial isoform X2 [Lampetra fluviatilis]
MLSRSSSLPLGSLLAGCRCRGFCARPLPTPRASSCRRFGSGKLRPLSAVTGSLPMWYVEGLRGTSHSRLSYPDGSELQEVVNQVGDLNTRRCFITEPRVAHSITEALQINEGDEAVVFDCSAGPGILTRALLNSGANRVVVLERDKLFLPPLQELEESAEGRMNLFHCDVFKLDTHDGLLRPPFMSSKQLQVQLGLKECSWNDEIPIRLVGILPLRNPRTILWRLIYAAFQGISVFRFGRVELNLFISERELQKIRSSPGGKNYSSLSILWQIMSDITVIYQESLTSVVTCSNKALKTDFFSNHVQAGEKLCLMQLNPRREITSVLNYHSMDRFMAMINHCLSRRRKKLEDILNLWNPGSGALVMAQLGLSPEATSGAVSPRDYLRLFEIIELSEGFRSSWLYTESMDKVIY